VQRALARAGVWPVERPGDWAGVVQRMVEALPTELEHHQRY